jgi:hypothetical protein
MSFRDSLPAGCPPDAAEEIATPREVFRLVPADPPSLADFKSQRQENPNKRFPGVSECVVCGISVFGDKHDAVAKAQKLPRLRNHKVCRVTLIAGAGRIQPTFQPSHQTWWPLAAFDILAHSGVETA